MVQLGDQAGLAIGYEHALVVDGDGAWIAEPDRLVLV
jgi:hypothetical protein